MDDQTTELETKITKRQVVATGNAPEVSKKRTVEGVFNMAQPRFEKALESTGMSPSRFVRSLITIVNKNPKLMEAVFNNQSAESLLAACLDMAALGLDPSIPNEVYLIPYGNVVNCQVGYKGLAKLALRAASEAGAPLVSLQHFAVYENDDYRRQRGTKSFCTNKEAPFGCERGDLLGYVATFTDSNGLMNYVEMTVKEIAEHKAKYPPKGPMAKPENAEAYGLKTVLRRLITRHMNMGIAWGDTGQRIIDMEDEPEKKLEVVENNKAEDDTEAV